MADWSLPTTTSLYTDVLSILKSRDVDAGTLFVSSPTNPPTGAIRYVRASNKFQEWDGSTWNDKVLDIAGGGTGAATASGARTSLGLGSMSTQNSSAVAITGGTITGVSLDASTITTGTVALARGGTGASLSLGANGSVLQSNGSAVVFGLIVNQNVDAAAAIVWTKISKAGSSLADLSTRSASDLSSGTLPDARFPATLPAVSGVNLTNLSASNLASGTVATTRLGSGTANSGTFLRGDQSWQAVPTPVYFGSWANPSVFDSPVSAATDLIVCVTVGNSGAASITVGNSGLTFFCGGNGVGGGNSVPVAKGDYFIVHVNGGTPVTDVDYRTLTLGT